MNVLFKLLFPVARVLHTLIETWPTINYASKINKPAQTITEHIHSLSYCDKIIVNQVFILASLTVKPARWHFGIQIFNKS